jgi:uncharacterized HAD superfamily protein
MKKLILSIDFDGTICDLAYPEIGELKKDARKYITKLYEDGHYIIINTCRSGKFEGYAEEFLNNNVIPYNFINCNLPHMIEEYSGDCRKISADIYIDDKCLMGLPETWEEIYNLIQLKINNERV